MSHGGGDDEADSLQIAAGDLPFLPSCNLIQLSEWREHTEREMMSEDKKEKKKNERGEICWICGAETRQTDRVSLGLQNKASPLLAFLFFFSLFIFSFF